MILPSYIWQLTGRDTEGPNVLILGGVHGDELTGIDVMRRLLATLDLLNEPAGIFARDDIRGNLFVGFGNPEAIVRCTRAASRGLDLNRSFTPHELDEAPADTDRMDLRRARELAPLRLETDFLIDVHGTSTPSVPFVCCGNDSPAHRELYSRLPVRYVLTDPHRVYTRYERAGGELGTTDDIVNTRGGGAWSERHTGVRRGVAICYEAGQAQDIGGGRMRAILAHVMDLVSSLGVTTPAFDTLFADLPRETHNEPQEVYAIVENIAAKSDAFTYEPSMEECWREVAAHQLVGRYADGAEERAPRAGMMLFPAAPGRVKTDKKLYCIAERIS